MEEMRNVIQAVAVIDIDPSFTPFFQEQQKWLTSIQILNDIPREKQNAKSFLILPGVYIVLSFCQKNKDPIYQIEFNAKLGNQWNQVKIPESIQTSLGGSLCYKTEPTFLSEPISDIDILKTQRRNMFGENKEIFNVPPSYKLISHQLPFGYLIFRKVKSKIQQNFKAILLQKYLSQKASRINLSQLPLFCFPEGIKIVRQIRGFLTFNFVFTLQTAQRIYVTCLIFKESLDQKKKQKLQVIQHGQLFYEKALCIVSNQCYTDQFGQCLQHLYRLSMSKSDIPFWRVIKTFVQQMKMPLLAQQGQIGLFYGYGGIRANFSTNRKYPFVSQRALYSVFKFMSLEKIISVFQSLLLQRKVIFVSQSKTILGYATEAFLGLLYPFKWQQVLIPILPSNLKQYLTAPVPLIAGISPSLVDSSIQSDSVIVYLDKNQILNDQDNPPLPEKLLKQLYKRLEKLQIYDPAQVTEFLENPQSTYLFKMQEVQDPQFHGHLVRDSFLEFLLTLMKNYKKFLVKPKINKQQESSMISFSEPALMNNIFKVQDFLSDLGMTKVGSFGYKFTQSSIFTSFIQRRHQRPNDPELVFFDQCIDRKKSKKQASFITSFINRQYRPIKNPEPIAGEGPFFYQQFPSLLQDSIVKQDIQIIIIDQKQEENKLISIVEEEYMINHDLFQPYQNENELKNKMIRLLLNKNKSKLQSQKTDDKLLLIKSFLGLYEKQTAQIESLLTQWPGVVCQQQFTPIKKSQYLLKINNIHKLDGIVGILEGDDFQTLIRKQTKIMFVGLGQAPTFSHRTSAIVVQIGCHRLKYFINKILPKQSGFIVDFCLKQACKDIRSSSLKRSSQQSWNIETILSLKNWIHYQKQYGTGVTNQ